MNKNQVIRLAKLSKKYFEAVHEAQGYEKIEENLNKIGFRKIGDGAYRVAFGNGEVVSKIALGKQNLYINEKALNYYRKYNNTSKLRKHIAKINPKYSDKRNYRWIVQEHITGEKPEMERREKLANKFYDRGIKIELDDIAKRKNTETLALYDLVPTNE